MAKILAWGKRRFAGAPILWIGLADDGTELRYECVEVYAFVGGDGIGPLDETELGDVAAFGPVVYFPF